MKKNKNIIILVCVVVVVIIGILLILINSNKNNKNNDNNSISEISLEDIITNKANTFYKEHYYNKIDKKDKLSAFESNGLSIKITDLVNFVKFTKEEKTTFDKKKCSYDESMVVIYPNSPFGENDYKLKIELSCQK